MVSQEADIVHVTAEAGQPTTLELYMAGWESSQTLWESDTDVCGLPMLVALHDYFQQVRPFDCVGGCQHGTRLDFPTPSPC